MSPGCPVAEHVRVRQIEDDEGQCLLRIIRRGTGSVVTRRRGRTVLLSAQGMPVAKIAEVTFTSADRVRAGSTTSTPTASRRSTRSTRRPAQNVHPPERREIKKTAKSKPAEHGLPFST